jgi:hypothetical protein
MSINKNLIYLENRFIDIPLDMILSKNRTDNKYKHFF